MENSFYTPSEVIKSNIKSAVAKANLPLAKMILLGMMAGAFIAFGGAASSVAAHGVADVGLARSIAGAIFPVGLMLVVFTGSELFTGNSLMIMAVIDKKITLLKMIRNLVVVYFANFIGALIIDVLVFLSGQFDFSGGGLGAYTIKVALAKTSIAPVTAVISGILCNILVCLAIVLAGTAKDSIGRIFGIFFPIAAFVVCGFEHCVANMFMIPLGIITAHSSTPEFWQQIGVDPMKYADLDLYHFIVKNLIPVTLGNIVGGAVCIGLFQRYLTKAH